jgi:miniconductance mechanosensitive channel
LENLGKVGFLRDHIAKAVQNVQEQTTNLELFIEYAQSYLRSIKEIRQRRYPFVVRVLGPAAEGLPLEIYVFVKASSWEKFEDIQAKILIHLIAVLPYFDLKAYQI